MNVRTLPRTVCAALLVAAVAGCSSAEPEEAPAETVRVPVVMTDKAMNGITFQVDTSTCEWGDEVAPVKMIVREGDKPTAAGSATFPRTGRIGEQSGVCLMETTLDVTSSPGATLEAEYFTADGHTYTDHKVTPGRALGVDAAWLIPPGT